jgi:outer membrane protein assembly factor BamA
VFGSPATLGMSLYRNVLKPWTTTSAGRSRLYRSDSRGLKLYAEQPTGADSTATFSYDLSRTSTQLRLSPAIALPGLTLDQLGGTSTKSALGVAWERAHPGEFFAMNSGVAGSALGGDENSVQAALSYSRTAQDPLTQRNSWAARGFVAGISGFGGRSLPLASRLYPGEEFLRGFRSGELTPYLLMARSGTNGLTQEAVSSGATLLSVFNAEYRVPLARRVELAVFGDLGSTWTLPSWLGPGSATILRGTSGVWRASTGIELRIRLPLIEQPLRFHYAWNPLRLAETFLLPDGSRFRPSGRRTAFGWALGLMF